MVSAHGRTRYAVSRSAFRVALLLYLPLRLFMATLPGGAGDVQGYRDWSLGSACVHCGPTSSALAWLSTCGSVPKAVSRVSGSSVG